MMHLRSQEEHVSLEIERTMELSDVKELVLR